MRIRVMPDFLTGASTAIAAMIRIKNFNAEAFFKDKLSMKHISMPHPSGQSSRSIDESLRYEAHIGYHRSWNGTDDNLKETMSKTVYSSLKRVLLANKHIATRSGMLADDKGYGIKDAELHGDVARYGRLTGSTEGEIEEWMIGKKTLVAGIRGGRTWPSNSGSFSAPLGDVLKDMEEFGTWKINDKIKRRITNEAREAYYNKMAEHLGEQLRDTNINFDAIKQRKYRDAIRRVRAKQISATNLKEQKVKITWDRSGMKIEWPFIAKFSLGLRDRVIPSESYETKLYDNKKSASSFFKMRDYFINSTMAVLDSHIQGLWDATSQEGAWSPRDEADILEVKHYQLGQPPGVGMFGGQVAQPVMGEAYAPDRTHQEFRRARKVIQGEVAEEFESWASKPLGGVLSEMGYMPKPMLDKLRAHDLYSVPKNVNLPVQTQIRQVVREEEAAVKKTMEERLKAGLPLTSDERGILRVAKWEEAHGKLPTGREFAEINPRTPEDRFPADLTGYKGSSVASSRLSAEKLANLRLTEQLENEVQIELRRILGWSAGE